METNNSKINFSCSPIAAVIIFLAFFFAKIFNLIDWSWWWVFSPFWLPLLISIVLCILVISAKIIIEK